MKEYLIHIWNTISTLGIHSESKSAEIRLTKTLNRLALIAACAVLPFAIPSINPTYDSFGWIEFVSGMGFLLILLANASHQKEAASFILVLTANFKIFFSASSRGWEAGEQLFFIPLLVGLLLLYDLKKQKMAWLVWGLSLVVFLILEITDYALLLPEAGYPESVMKEIFTLNFLISAIIILAITYYYSRLANQQQEEILLSQQQVLNASQAKSEFLSVISHELWTPLHAILNYADMISETGLDTEQQELSNGLKLSGKSLSVIVNHILSVSQIGEEFDPPDLKLFDSQTPLLGTAEIFRPQAAKKNLPIIVTVAESPYMIQADESRLFQVMGLLVDNAIKFSDSGTITLSSEIIRGKEMEIGEIIYRIQDQGNGISAEDLTEIFTPFFMNDASINRLNGGLGLGLTICKRLVESMNGQIHIQSILHQGSTISVHIPIDIQPPVTQNTIQMPNQTQEPVSLDIINILLVDDHPVNQKVASTMLRKLGYEYQMASNGVEALAAAESGGFHLIFMDIQMPVMDGIESTRRIRTSLPKERQPIIVALTANTTEGDKKACFSAGMDDFLAKPVTKSVIEKSINKWKTKIPRLT